MTLAGELDGRLRTSLTHVTDGSSGPLTKPLAEPTPSRLHLFSRREYLNPSLPLHV
ncbi:predicted protein [Plenodomus lingam JN3]|uniref:Predicted protein n=1 Tax=Leptosphaeria maculans (strain JN3 / isolate v23.1.3 / race Av1-4-5-6-7-8) TaxID=985895 RepID=E5AEA2_LEPMJ|nr:predicted protein [Plenodomus lingam JN3]CBY01541.1 predicted protein [Plenodomus lingam JN3]